MSANSSNAETTDSSVTLFARAVGGVLGYSLWAMVAVFVVPAFLILGINQALKITGVLPGGIVAMDTALATLSLFAAQFILGFGVLMLLPKLIQKMSWKNLAKLLGVFRWPRLSDIGLALLAFVAYFVSTAIVQALLIEFMPGYNVDEVQNVGFSTGIVGVELILAGIALVILAPVFEELIFRGYLFGSIRKYVPFWLTALVVSVLFGLAHGQVNVGVDVFVLSIFMCTVRERTGTVWPTILMHMIKNGLAFYLLFVNPELVQSLMG